MFETFIFLLLKMLWGGDFCIANMMVVSSKCYDLAGHMMLIFVNFEEMILMLWKGARFPQKINYVKQFLISIIYNISIIFLIGTKKENGSRVEGFPPHFCDGYGINFWWLVVLKHNYWIFILFALPFSCLFNIISLFNYIILFTTTCT